MALKATIFKAELRIADVDRGYYEDHALTIARHPSETDERMMVRVLAFALHAHDALTFGSGLATDDEPDLWRKDLTGAIEAWIDVGKPDERRVRRACGRAARVFVYAYGGHGVDAWWEKVAAGFERISNLTVMKLSSGGSQAAAGLAQRTMALQCTIQDGQVWMSDTDRTVQVDLTLMSGPARTRDPD
jgi:uncharacterized protein YaeQ